MNFSTEKKIRLVVAKKIRLVVAKGEGEGEGVGWIGGLGLIDMDCCLWNGLAMRSCYIALGTISSHL